MDEWIVHVVVLDGGGGGEMDEWIVQVVVLVHH